MALNGPPIIRPNWQPIYPDNDDGDDHDDDGNDGGLGQRRLTDGDRIARLRRQMNSEDQHRFDAQVAQKSRNLLQIAERQVIEGQLPISTPDPVPKRTWIKKKTHGKADARGLSARELAERRIRDAAAADRETARVVELQGLRESERGLSFREIFAQPEARETQETQLQTKREATQEVQLQATLPEVTTLPEAATIAVRVLESPPNTPKSDENETAEVQVAASPSGPTSGARTSPLPLAQLPIRTPERPRPRRSPSPEASPVVGLPSSTAPPNLGGATGKEKRKRVPSKKAKEAGAGNV